MRSVKWSLHFKVSCFLFSWFTHPFYFEARFIVDALNKGANSDNLPSPALHVAHPAFVLLFTAFPELKSVLPHAGFFLLKNTAPVSKAIWAKYAQSFHVTLTLRKICDIYPSKFSCVINTSNNVLLMRCQQVFLCFKFSSKFYMNLMRKHHGFYLLSMRRLHIVYTSTSQEIFVGIHHYGVGAIT